MTKTLAILVALAELVGCACQQAGPSANVVTRVGFLAEDVMQHPIVSGNLNEKREQFALLKTNPSCR